MILKSHFSQFIRENKNKNIIHLLQHKYKLNVTYNYGLYLIQYTSMSKFKFPLVKECKNIVCDSLFNIISVTRNKHISEDQFKNLVEPDWHKKVLVSPIIEGDYVYLFFHKDTWYISNKIGIFNVSTKTYQTISKLLDNKLPISQLNRKYCYTFILTKTSYNQQRLYLTNCFQINNSDIETNIETINIGIFKNKLPLIKILYNFTNLEEIYEYLKLLKNHKQEHMLKGFILKYEPYQCKISNITNKNIYKQPDKLEVSKHLTRKITRELQRYYHSYFIKKTISFSKVPIKYKKHCHNLHKDFIYKLIPDNYVSRDIVKTYLNYLSNYDKRLLIKSSKVDSHPIPQQHQQSTEEPV